MKSPFLGTDTSCISSTPAGIYQPFFLPASDFIPPTVLWLLHQSNPCWQCCVRLHPFQEKACWYGGLQVMKKGVLTIQGH